VPVVRSLAACRPLLLPARPLLGQGLLGFGAEAAPAAASPPPPAADSLAPGLPALDAVVAEHLPEGGPGIAVAAVLRGEVLHARGYGWAVRGQDPVPVTPDTAFNLASLSKAMTAMLALQLAEAGRLDLDADVRPLLAQGRGAPPPGTWEAGRPVSARDLIRTLGSPTARGTYDFAHGRQEQWVYQDGVRGRTYVYLDQRTRKVTGWHRGP